MKQPTISIVGTGYVGLSTATILANAGFKVYTVDIDENKIETIKKGKSYFYELGLDEMIQKGLKSGNLIPTISYEESIPNSDIIFSCVGTPDREDGSPNLDYIYAAAKSVVENATKPFIYVQKSTVPVGTGRKLTEYMKDLDSSVEFDYVSNPEFLREGAAVYDTLNMDRVVVGNENNEILEKVLTIYKAVDELAQRTDLTQIGIYATDNNPAAKKFSEKPFEQRIVKTSLESAELIKVSANAFLALKISYANEIAMLCDKTGADITEVMRGIGMDHRIGRAFLFAGRGYGGGCFPKDVSGLISVGDENKVDMDIMKAATVRNNSMPDYILDKAKETLGETLKGKKIAVLGLAFKTGTSDTRKSPGIKIANLAVKRGATVVATDPQAMEEAAHTLDKAVQMVDTPMDALQDADLVIVTTPWKDFLDISPKQYLDVMNGDLFVDAVNAFDKEDVKKAGFRYVGVGRR